MPGRALIAGSLILLSACSTPRERIVPVREPVEVEIPVVVRCPAPEVSPTYGPDFAGPDADIYEAAQYAAARIVGLRREVGDLRDALGICTTGGTPDISSR